MRPSSRACATSCAARSGRRHPLPPRPRRRPGARYDHACRSPSCTGLALERGSRRASRAARRGPGAGGDRRRASGRASARRYGRSFVIASKASTVEDDPRASGIAPRGGPGRRTRPALMARPHSAPGARAPRPRPGSPPRGPCARTTAARAGSAAAGGRGSAPAPQLADVVQDRDELELEQDVGRRPKPAPTRRQSRPAGWSVGRAPRWCGRERRRQARRPRAERLAGVRSGDLSAGRSGEQSRQRWRSRCRTCSEAGQGYAATRLLHCRSC